MKRSTRLGGVVVVLLLAGLGWWGTRPKPGSIEPLEAAVDGGSAPATRPATTVKTTVASAVDSGLPEARTGGGKQLARFGWGSGEGNLGRTRADESNPEAPMSLTVDGQGQVWIVDQVNERLVKLDRSGKVVGTVPIPLQAAQDVVVAPDGTALVLDRLVDKSIAVIGPDGKQKGELPILGKGLEEGGASTGLFTDGKEVYVEREHGDSVRIGSAASGASALFPASLDPRLPAGCLLLPAGHASTFPLGAPAGAAALSIERVAAPVRAAPAATVS